MRHLSIISFTLQGGLLGEALQEKLVMTDGKVQAYAAGKWLSFLPASLPSGAAKVWARDQWKSADGLIFIGACGIAVRSIAPLVQAKTADPAVIVLDEKGEHVISLLSGHLGGANDLARRIAAITGGEAVITTATDVEGKFAVDVWAQENGLAISSMALAREISAAVLAGEKVGFQCPLPVEGRIPDELTGGAQARLQIRVGVRRSLPEAFVPDALILGIGCKRGKTASEIARQIEQFLAEADIRPEAIARAVTIDRKADEAGLLAYCEAMGWPLAFYTADELRAVPGEFSPSAFVEQTVAVDNVCERAAMRGGGIRLLMRKKAANGITAAIAVTDRRIRFG